MNKDCIVEVAQNGNPNELLQQEHYYPFGMGIKGEWKFVQPQIGGVNAYQYNGKELNDDFGLNWNDYGARWYDASIARWNAVDPLAVDYSSWSGYNYVLGNPLKYIDPDGMRVEGDFYSQYGAKIGSDGIDDGKIYVLNDADAKHGRRIQRGKNGQETISKNDFSGEIVELPSSSVRAAIGRSLEASNSSSGDDKEGGFHEEGGFWGTTENGEEKIAPAKAGGYSNPFVDAQATIRPFDAVDSELGASITNVEGSFHVHPKGVVSEEVNQSDFGTSSSKRETRVGSFAQPPSNIDVNAAHAGGNTNGYNIVVGARSQTVYIYGSAQQNQSGKTYRAEFPLQKFLKIK